ncbi:sensor histidine kinase [Leptothrix discophora]|uniref:histidine kinase n=1 Tax=Leptothrix discophora TaxID=89 RepID=A0ABT9G5A3_LEPDI|nr:ATP-binding protein [Leptothrix discophora]MDP4301672.1 ATP-binding protein [Leptothrix discophora]
MNPSPETVVLAPEVPSSRPPAESATSLAARLRQPLRAIAQNLHPARWGLLLTTLVLVVLWGLEVAASGSTAGSVLLTQASMVRIGSDGRPVEAEARPVTLPHLRERPARDESGVHEYRLAFAAPSSPRASAGEMLAAFLPQVCASFEVRLNGQLIDARGKLADPHPGDCYEPALTPLPPGLLKPEGNRLDVRVAGQALTQVASRERAAQLAPVRIGPHAALDPLHRQTLAFNLGATHALATVAAVVGLAALVLRASSQLPYFGYFGAAALGWALLAALLTGAALPLPGIWTELLIAAFAPPVALAAMLYLLRYCGLRVVWLEVAVALQCVVVPASLALAAPDRIHSVALPWVTILVLEVIGVGMVFLQRAWRYSRNDFWIGAVALSAFVVTMAAELLGSPGAVLLPGKHAISVALVVMFAGMVGRMHQLFQGAIAAAEQGRVQAERRLLQATADMEQNYGQMAELRVEQVTAKERKRIAADLHDDLGAKLLTIVHTADNDRISTLAREALEEMRLSVRGLTGRAMQIGDAIGDWRSELMTRFSHGGVELVWNAADELLMSERAMSARAYVQTTRILREAVSNVLKHSRATRCEITIRQDHNDFELTIADNGKGIPTELDGKLDRGHGMSTMKGRAKQLQGQCLVESGPGYGTTIRLTLPL